jgi:hypothetical protein
MQHEEREAEHPERVLGPQFAAVDVHVEPLGEPAHGRGGEVTGLRVDIGQVVTGLLERAVAVRDQAAAGPRPGCQRGGSSPAAAGTRR